MVMSVRVFMQSHLSNVIVAVAQLGLLMASHLAVFMKAQAAHDEPNLAFFPPVTKIMHKSPFSASL